MATRGHREDEKSMNRGNFLELLELRSHDIPVLNDKSIKFKYLSHQHQDEILNIIASKIKKTICIEMRDKPFSIIVDETPDISTHEQVTFCVRYPDENLRIRERFIGFVRTESTTGEELEKLVVAEIESLGIFWNTTIL